MQVAKIDQLTFTRFIAAISIVIYHTGKDIYPFNHESIRFLFEGAYIGVSYFFVLSGFIMVFAYQARPHVSPLYYYRNRLARIYPLYFLVMVIFAAERWARGEFNAGQTLLCLLMLQSWVPGQALALNSPSWSLSVEVLFYAVFPFIFNALYTRARLKPLLLGVISFWMASQMLMYWMLSSGLYQGYPSPSHDLIYYFPLMHLNEFLLGNVAALVLGVLATRHGGNYTLLLAVLVAVVVLLLKYTTAVSIYHDGLLAILFCSFMIALSLDHGPVSALFSKRPFVFLGEISYAIYLSQFLVYGVVKRMKIQDSLVLFLVYLLCLLITSALLYHFVESPARKMIQGLGLKSRPVLAK